MNTEFLMDDYCFACGSKNKNGLKLDIFATANGVEANIKLPLWAQGYENIIHGGIISTILDEMAVWAAYKKGYKCVTAELKVRIKKSMNINDEYIAQGNVTAVKHRLIQVQSTIVNKDNELIASAEVKLLRSNQIQ